MKREDRTDAQHAITLVLSLAKLDTMRKAYERLMPGPDGRVRTSLSIVGTETGRLASSEAFYVEGSTNLQNQAKKVAKLDPLFDVRALMKPDPGMVLVEADYSGIEARLTAAYAKDTKLLEAFARYDAGEGPDPHTLTAAEIFGVASEDVTWEQRHLGKMRRHGSSYGQQWRGFMESVNADADLTGVALSASRAKEIDAEFRRNNANLLSWQRRMKEQVREDGFLETIYGRKRIFLDRSGAAMNSAIAFLPQSTAADLVNRALVVLWNLQERVGFEVLLQIHDAVLVQCEQVRWRSVARAMKRVMEGDGLVIDGVKISTPVDVSVSSSSWADMKEVMV